MAGWSVQNGGRKSLGINRRSAGDSRSGGTLFAEVIFIPWHSCLYTGPWCIRKFSAWLVVAFVRYRMQFFRDIAGSRWETLLIPRSSNHILILFPDVCIMTFPIGSGKNSTHSKAMNIHGCRLRYCCVTGIKNWCAGIGNQGTIYLPTGYNRLVLRPIFEFWQGTVSGRLFYMAIWNMDFALEKQVWILSD